jgi:hypothetical protein
VSTAAAVALGITAVITAPAAGAASGAGQGKDCVTVTSPAESSTHVDFIGGFPPGQKTGDAYTYYDDITDDTGAVIGHTVGYSSVYYMRASDGHPMAQYEETVVLNDGSSLHTSAILDRKAIGEAQWVSLPAIGTTGIFKDKVGVRRWQLRPEVPGGTVRVVMTLCGK